MPLEKRVEELEKEIALLKQQTVHCNDLIDTKNCDASGVQEQLKRHIADTPRL